MKKIFYFIASAIVALGAVACQNDIDENIENNQQTEGISVKVTIAEQTRVALGELDAENKRKLTFTEGDQLVATLDRQNGTKYIFTYTKVEGDVYTFTCNDQGVSELIGTKPNFYYLGGLDAGTCTTYNSVCNTAAEDITGVGMYAAGAEWDQPNGNLGDEGHTVNLHVLPLLKFTANESVKFESDFASLFFVDGWNSSYTTTKTGEIYLPIMPSSGIECEVTVTTESGFNKTFKKVFNENTIYNLGTIAKETQHKVYVYNNNKDWTKVNLYSWDDASNNFTGAWPGTQMTETAMVGANEFLVYTMPAAATGKVISFIANNGSAQTGDFVMPAALNSDLYLLLNGNALSIIENPEEFTPAAPETHKLYIYNKVNWSKLNLYSWNDAGTITGAWPGTAITTTEMVGEVKYYAYTMPASVTGTIFSIIINNGSAQTGDFALPSAFTSDVYLLLDSGNLSVIKDPAKPEGDVTDEPTVGQNSAWSVSGSFNSWGDAVMVTTETQNVFVAKGIKLSAYSQFKVRKDKAWTEGYGGGIVYMNNNSYIKVFKDGSDINNTVAGTFDIYFDYNNKYVYLMTSGTDYKTAALQEKEGAQPDTSSFSWGLCGVHNNWGTNDTALTWDGTLGLYVAKNVKLSGAFKVRADKSWSTNFGSGGTVTVDKAAATTLYNNGGDCKPSKTGNFDVYFWYDKTDVKKSGKIWIKTVGSAAPTL